MSKNCVLKGTLITLKDKKDLIENLKIKDTVLCYNIHNLENTQDINLLINNNTKQFSGNFSHKLIKNIWKKDYNIYYLINNSLGITADHFIFCKRNNSYFWTNVSNLKLNDYLFKENNKFEKILSIDIIKTNQKFYNLGINTIYNFFANGYLIHNSGFNCDTEICSECFNAYSGGAEPEPEGGGEPEPEPEPEPEGGGEPEPEREPEGGGGRR